MHPPPTPIPLLPTGLLGRYHCAEPNDRLESVRQPEAVYTVAVTAFNHEPAPTLAAGATELDRTLAALVTPDTIGTD